MNGASMAEYVVCALMVSVRRPEAVVWSDVGVPMKMCGEMRSEVACGEDGSRRLVRLKVIRPQVQPFSCLNRS